MREIKFKCWDEEKNKFVPPYNFVSAVVGDLTLELKNNDRVIFLQYTGLKDKNGVEIYEGDIVKQTFETHDYWDNRDTSINTYIGKVVFDNEDLTYKVLNKSNKLIGYLDIFDKCTIIGNIYENPKLLKD